MSVHRAWLVPPFALLLACGGVAPSPPAATRFVATAAPVDPPASATTRAPMTLRHGAAEFVVDPTTLAVESHGVVLSGPLDGDLSHPSLDPSADGLRVRFPARGLSVDAHLDGASLVVRLTSDRDQAISWPRPRMHGVRSLALPIGEGLVLPIGDPFWRERFRGSDCLTAHEGLSMPFFGLDGDAGGFATVLATDLGTRVCVRPQDEVLSVAVEHAFSVRDGLAPYEVVFAPSDGTPIGSALAYRALLDSRHALVSLDDKTRALPRAELLRGAVHAYLWGDGRSGIALDELRSLGVERALLAFDDTGDARPVTADVVRHAEALGYVVAPYDTLDNVQDPARSDARSSTFDEDLFRRGGVLDADGRRVIGFGGRGFALSSEALRRAAVPYLDQRVAHARALGASAYFLDCDAFGELYDDFDPAHPMTRARDRENRLARMRAVAGAALLLGSESAVAWSAPVVVFSHGTETLPTDAYWRLQGDKERFGRWVPTARPTMFFRPVSLTDDERRELFDPAVRAPLYQAVFHDAVIATDRWEMSLPKVRGLEPLRTLLSLVYGVPTMWNLDRRALREDGPRLRQLARFFGPLHRRIAGLPLTAFEYVTPDRLLQRSRFGDDVELVANFAAEPRAGVPGGCVEARMGRGGARDVLCPLPPATTSIAPASR